MKFAAKVLTLALPLFASATMAVPAYAQGWGLFSDECGPHAIYRLFMGQCMPYEKFQHDPAHRENGEFHREPAPKPSKIAVSDRRLKNHLVRVGTAADGLPLYDFQYNGQAGTYEGVMAQDVLKVMPAAVSVGANGYYQVDYGMLGLEMKRIR